MRKQTILVLVSVALLVAALPVMAQESSDSTEPAHLVLTVDNGADARINRMDWDVNAFAFVFPGTAARGSDYIDLSGRTTVQILCADLALIEQRGSEVPPCDPYPTDVRFFYYNDPSWFTEGANTVVTYPDDLAAVPAEVANPGAYNLNELVGSELEAVRTDAETITGLGLPAEAQAFALASLYRGKEMYFQALAELSAIAGLECSARRPSVTPPEGDTRTLVQSPVLYIRIGELYELLAQREDALRNFRCAGELAQTIGDPATTALAFARWANLEPDAEDAIQYYQIAIDNYAQLQAMDSANAMLEICGSRNCAMP
jgi:tetratricopeptide (TPR) repeat protein